MTNLHDSVSTKIAGMDNHAPHKRGNPNWGKLQPHQPALPTEFELRAVELSLAPQDYVESTKLREWCLRNRNRCYIPEWLLKAWEMDVDPAFT